jgi:hypothetical protein
VKFTVEDTAPRQLETSASPVVYAANVAVDSPQLVVSKSPPLEASDSTETASTTTK